SGDFKAVVPIQRRDEIGQLSTAFAIMTRELDKAQNELLSRNQELLALNSLAATVSQSLDLEEILAKATQKVLAVTNSEAGCVFLSDARKKELKLVSYTGSSNLFRCLQSRSGTANCACHQVLNFGHALLVNDVSQCPMLAKEATTRESTPYFVSVPLKSKDKVLGVMNVTCSAERCFTERDFELMHSIGYHVGLAVENSMLYQETRQKEELRGQLLSTIINAQEEERKRISRELHDGCAQTLTGLIMSIESAENMASYKPSAVTEKLASTRLIATRVLEDMRKLMRGLRSTDLDELGLVAAIHSNAKTNLEAADIQLDFEAQGFNHSLHPSIETTLFRIVQEAVHNVIKHAGARLVTIRMRMEDSKIAATIADDGRGFDAATFFTPGTRVQSLGLIGMQERASLLGGSLSITSTPGQGTLIVVEIPIDASSDSEETPDEQ
ncbi:MAG: GAF domain-containing protein, partial [Chloroflexota bacterium]